MQVNLGKEKFLVKLEEPFLDRIIVSFRSLYIVHIYVLQNEYVITYRVVYVQTLIHLSIGRFVHCVSLLEI